MMSGLHKNGLTSNKTIQAVTKFRKKTTKCLFICWLHTNRNQELEKQCHLKLIEQLNRDLICQAKVRFYPWKKQTNKQFNSSQLKPVKTETIKNYSVQGKAEGGTRKTNLPLLFVRFSSHQIFKGIEDPGDPFSRRANTQAQSSKQARRDWMG